MRRLALDYSVLVEPRMLAMFPLESRINLVFPTVFRYRTWSLLRRPQLPFGRGTAPSDWSRSV